MTVRCLGIIFLLLTGCTPALTHRVPTADAGRAVFVQERTNMDGTKETLRVEYLAPQNDSKGSQLTVGSDLIASFGGQYEVKQLEGPSAGHNMGQYILYGCGAVCVVVGLGLVGIGRHIKLGAIAFAGAGVFFTIAVTIDQFAWIFAYLLAGGVVVVLAAIGWAMWRDYKEYQRGLSILPELPPSFSKP